MKHLNIVVASTVLGLVLAAWGLGNASEALAQEKCKRMIGRDAATSKYTEQHVMDVGDVPGHQIRIFELHRTYTNAKPNCEGLKRKEQWVRGYSDYINRNGSAWGYQVITMENGDKIFAKFSGTSLTSITPDGKKKSTYTGVTRYTGGTGMYKGIRGMERVKVAFDPIANVNVKEAEKEYWIVK